MYLENKMLSSPVLLSQMEKQHKNNKCQHQNKQKTQIN